MIDPVINSLYLYILVVDASNRDSFNSRHLKALSVILRTVQDPIYNNRAKQLFDLIGSDAPISSII
jgi:hypothetical protein